MWKMLKNIIQIIIRDSIKLVLWYSQILIIKTKYDNR